MIYIVFDDSIVILMSHQENLWAGGLSRQSFLVAMYCSTCISWSVACSNWCCAHCQYSTIYITQTGRAHLFMFLAKLAYDLLT